MNDLPWRAAALRSQLLQGRPFPNWRYNYNNYNNDQFAVMPVVVVVAVVVAPAP